MASPLEILNTVFGFPAFRGQQAEVIDHVVAGGDALVLMPTGAGKSLCYQVPALCRDGIAVVVSPLIALMQNQVEALNQLGVRAAALNSARSFDEAMVIERKMQAGELDLVYVAPERLVTPGFLSLLETCRIALFAIDEAHCVSQWGHTSVRNICNWPCCTGASPPCPASPSPPPPTAPPAGISPSA